MTTKTKPVPKKASKPVAKKPQKSDKSGSSKKAAKTPVAKGGKRTGDAPRSTLDLEETKKLEAKRAKPDASGPKKVSAIDAAFKVLAGSKEPLNCKELIEAMAAKKLWTSPGGKTPHATLYSAILREITTKGKDARFTKAERGKFAANA